MSYLKKLIFLLLSCFLFTVLINEKTYASIPEESNENIAQSCEPEFCVDEPGDGGPIVANPIHIPLIEMINKSESYYQPYGEATDIAYYFIAPTTGYVDIMIYTGVLDSSFRFIIYDKNYNIVKEINHHHGFFHTNIDNLSVTPDSKYYIRIKHNDGYVNYWPNSEIYVTVTLEDDLRSDNPREIVSLAFSKIDFIGDTDYFKHKAYKIGNIRIRVTGYLGNISCRVYNSNNELIASDTNKEEIVLYIENNQISTYTIKINSNEICYYALTITYIF